MEIICPICKEELNKEDKRYFCINNHNFDIAKEGYVNLALAKTVDTGDSQESIVARNNFLHKDYYAFLKDEINNYIAKLNINYLTDLACGEGYYTSALNAKHKIGIDLSKKGLKVAAKSDKQTSYILASIFHTPIKSASQDMVLTCFAPIANQEIVRLLKDEGYFLLIRPARRHLYELKEVIYDTPYLNEEKPIEIDDMVLVENKIISNTCKLKYEDLKNLFMMTPYFYKTSPKDKEKLDKIKSLDITFAFNILLFRK